MRGCHARTRLHLLDLLPRLHPSSTTMRKLLASLNPQGVSLLDCSSPASQHTFTVGTNPTSHYRVLHSMVYTTIPTLSSATSPLQASSAWHTALYPGFTSHVGPRALSMWDIVGWRRRLDSEPHETSARAGQSSITS